jgi:hypothetical protein
MPGRNKTKGSKKLLMAKKARIRAYPEEEATRTAMADHLGHQGRLGGQKLTKENLAGPSVFLRTVFCELKQTQFFGPS